MSISLQQHSKFDPALRIKDASTYTGIGKSHLYDLVKRGEFPAPIPLGGRAHGWRLSDLNAWLDKQAESRNQAA